MKKKIALILILCIVATLLCGCSSTSYNEAKTSDTYVFSSGYFTILKEWYADDMGYCKILYANDTHVMYFYFDGAYTSGITPLYNADGTLQIYEGD